MAIKVTSNKKQVFHKKCPHCGVEFDYTYDDLEFHYWAKNGAVICPGCAKSLNHDSVLDLKKEEAKEE